MIDILEIKDNTPNKEIPKQKIIKFVPKNQIQNSNENDDKEAAEKLIKEIELIGEKTLQKEEQETILLKNELIKSFNQYVDEVKIDIEGNVVNIDEIKALAKNVFKSTLPQMIDTIQKGKNHKEFYESLLSTFEKQFYILIDKKLSGFTGLAIKKLSSKKLFEENKNIINLKVGEMMSDMMRSVVSPVGYKISYEMKNYNLGWSVESVNYYRTEYWTNEKKEDFFEKLNKKVYNELFK